MKIKTKYLGSIYLPVFLFSITILGLAFYLHKFTSKSINNILTYGNELELVGKLELAFVKAVMPANDYLIHGNKEEREIFEDVDAEINKIFEILEGKNFPTRAMAEERETLDRMKARYANIKIISDKIFSLHNPIGNIDGARLMEEMDSLANNMLENRMAFHRNSRLAVLREVEATDAYFNKYTITVLGITGLVIIASLSYGLFLTKGFIVPIRRLIEHMRLVAKSDFSQRLEINTKDEIGVLAERFNWMTKELETSYDTIREYTGKLEGMVKERTEELENTIEKLQVSNVKVENAKKDWENTFNSISDLISVHDNDYNLIRCNDAVARKFNVKPEDLIGKKCYEIFHCTGKPHPACPLVKCKETSKPITKEVENVPHLDGIYQMSCFPKLNESGKLSGIVHIAKDITERKRVEESARVSYKMASLGQLTVGVFHEVLNPLNIISSYTQLMLLKEEKGSEKERQLKQILEEVDRIAKIIDGLLIFSRKGNENVECVEIHSFLEVVISIVEPDMKLRNIEFIRKFEEKLPEIMANRDELRQVFMNIITNADDAMPNGGKLTISTLSIEKRGKSFVSIKFKDTGCGIKSNDIDKVFDPFFTTKKEGGGTGLGLSISYGIIRNHRGEMRVNSKEGKGTTFIIDLPAKT